MRPPLAQRSRRIDRGLPLAFFLLLATVYTAVLSSRFAESHQWNRKGIGLGDLRPHGWTSHRIKSRHCAAQIPQLDRSRQRLRLVSRHCAQILRNDTYDARASRVSLVLGERGIEALRASKVLVVGASKLAFEIITHLVRSGVNTVEVWHNSIVEARNMVRDLKILQPDANINLLDREPEYTADVHDAVIFVDQPLKEAIKANAVVRNRSKFMYATARGVYGIVLSDFGDVHKVAATSDKQYAEHQGTVKSSGRQSVIEVVGKNDVEAYKAGDNVTISLAAYLMPKYQTASCNSDTIVISAKVLRVDTVNQHVVRLYVDVDTQEWPKVSFAIRKVDPPTRFNFVPLDTLTRTILGKYGGLSNMLRRFFKGNDVAPERLVIAPASGSAINRKTRSVVAAFMAMDKVLMGSSYQKNSSETVNNACFVDACRGIYSQADPQVTETFNVLKQIDVPPVISLIGSLAAQEVVKALTGTFTTSDAIIIDRSDIFPDNGVGLSVDDAKKHVKLPSECEYLLVGAGALGCEYLKVLPRMGVTHVTVMDNDIVDLSNLTRQTLFDVGDVGKNKAVAALKNLRLITRDDLKNYVAQPVMFTDLFKRDPCHPNRQLLVVSAVDNIHARILMDNYAVDNSCPFVEAGIHGMQCSTSISIPHITDSYGASVGSEGLLDGRNSCSVKGIPRNVEDTVFYAMELFAWLFGSQHEVFNEFFKDPMTTLRAAIQRDEKHFINVVESITENCKVATSQTDTEKWANMTYKEYFGEEFPLRQLIVDAMSAIKRRSIHLVTPMAHKNIEQVQKLMISIKNMIKQHFAKHNTAATNDIRSKCFEAIEKMLNTPAVLKLLEAGGNVSLQPLLFNENYNSDCNFLFGVSNIRAHRFGMYQSDMATIVKMAKSIVPAISTTVGVAASMAMLEVYKAMPLIRQFKQQRDGNEIGGPRKSVTPGDLSLVPSERKNASMWFVVDKDEAKCFKRTKLIATLKLFDYTRNGTKSQGILNNFFNLSIMKYVPKCADPPEIFEVTNDTALLKGAHLSLWDHIAVQESSCSGPSGDQEKKSNDRSKVSNTTSGVTIGEMVDVISRLFGVTVEALIAKDNVVQVTEKSRRLTLRDAFSVEDTCIIYIVAKDNQLLQPIELPNIRYSV